MSDTIVITVLKDGTIKVETSAIGAANHASAEAFLREAAKLAGGEVTIETKHLHGAVQAQSEQHTHQ